MYIELVDDGIGFSESHTKDERIQPESVAYT